MLTLVIDMNLSPDWVLILQNAGWTTTFWMDIGSPSAPDTEIMRRAREHDAIVFTHDLDFGALLAASGESSPSVVQMRCEDTRPIAMGSLIVSAIQSSVEDLKTGVLLTLDPKRMRLRILPFRTEK